MFLFSIFPNCCSAKPNIWSVEWNLVIFHYIIIFLHSISDSFFFYLFDVFFSVGWPDLSCHSCGDVIDYCRQDWSNKLLLYCFLNQTQTSPHHVLSSPLTPYRFDFLLWCLCGACHTPTPQQRRLLLASSSVSSVSKSSRAATLPVPALTPARSPAPLTWWRWPSPRPSRLTCPRATAPTAASTAGHTWPTTTSSFQRYAAMYWPHR